MAYEGLDITLLGDTPISVLYSKPIGKTVVLMTDEHNHTRPVLFDGPVCGEHHFLEVRNREGGLEIISAVIKSKDLGLSTAGQVRLVPLLSRDKKAANKIVGLFDHTGGRGAFTYRPPSNRGYDILFRKLDAVGLVKWAQENPYRERAPSQSEPYTGNNDEAE